MQSALSLLAISALFASLSLGCTAQVEGSGAGQTGGGGGDGSGGSTSSGPIACTPQPDDWGAGVADPTCADLDPLALGAVVITDAGGDGKVSPGEGVTLSVQLQETSGKGFWWYLGVTFTSDVAVVNDAGAAQFYGIAGCGVNEAMVTLTIPASVAPGTAVAVKAQVSMLNTACPGAPSITLSIPVE